MNEKRKKHLVYRRDSPQYTKTVYDQVKGEVMPILLDINSYEHIRGGKI